MPLPDGSVPPEYAEYMAAREALYAAAAERAQAVSDLDARLRETGATARSPQGDVKVSVSSSGLLESLEISPRAAAAGGRALSRAIMTTLREALAQLERNVEEVVVETDAGAAGAQTLAQYRAGLATPLASLGDGTDLRQG